MHDYEQIIILIIMLEKIFGAISCSIKNQRDLTGMGFRHPALLSLKSDSVL